VEVTSYQLRHVRHQARHSSAPILVGNAQASSGGIRGLPEELARLVNGYVTKLYDVTSHAPGYEPDPTTHPVLHVSDIHLNPASWKIIRVARGAVRPSM